MKAPEFEWRLDSAPEPGEPDGLPAPPTPPRRRVWRPLVWGLALLAVAALAVYAYQRLGWQRLREQVAGEAAFEDERSRARDLMAVLAMQASDDRAWRHQRSAEAELGLAAPLPAPQLAPAGTAPQLLRLDTRGGDVFTATVRREYVDAAGRPYSFDLAQRYRNAGPGLWQRLAPNVPEQGRGWQGRWLAAATLPQGEESVWAGEVLPAVDALLDQACADWACPTDTVLRLNVSGVPDAIAPFAAPEWAGGSAPANSPAAFDVVNAYRLTPSSGPLDVAAFSLAGLPAGAPERQAIVHALTVRALFALATRLTFINGPAGDPYVVALLARAETRLGLADSSSLLPPADNLLTPSWLWDARELSSNTLTRHASTSSLAGRQSVLAFVNHALAGQDAAADGQLLKSLRRSRTVPQWLTPILGEAAAGGALRAWADALSAAYAAQASVPLLDAAGVYYACGEALYRASQGGSSKVLALGLASPVGFLGLDAHDHYLAYVRTDTDGQALELVLLDTATGILRPLMQSESVALFGWSSAGQLLFLDMSGGEGGPLLRYDPATGQTDRLFDGLLDPLVTLVPAWSADRTELGLNLFTQSTDAGPATAPVIARVVDPPGLEQQAPAGSGAWLSPDGQRVAYVLPVDLSLGPEQPRLTLRVAERGSAGRVLAEATHPLTRAEAGFIGAVSWAPDGLSLVYLVAPGDGPYAAYRLNLADGVPQALVETPPADSSDGAIPIGFSADGGYLGLLNFSNNLDSSVTVLTMPTGPVIHSGPLFGLTGFAWSPTGHTLALPSLGGLYLTDPATGAARWLTFDRCYGVTW